jgi:hypothetical protein
MYHASTRSIHCYLTSIVLVDPSCAFVPAAGNLVYYDPYFGLLFSLGFQIVPSGVRVAVPSNLPLGNY